MTVCNEVKHKIYVCVCGVGVGRGLWGADYGGTVGVSGEKGRGSRGERGGGHTSNSATIPVVEW